ncbi:maleylpyruvate isomerase N-terminal domain-containing protein [Streptomyces sp. NPDC060194]|uniref:maleylpyruvate isomerase N-terminal domain-containing protein n=1 Tax=Streptomyces sp. NPDC060194 TaxID=3347069 RepID=UPI003666245F
MTDDIRTTYLEAADAAVHLLATEQVAARWDTASVLDGMTVGGLAGHLARSVLQVEWFLDGEVGHGETVPAGRYYGRLAGTTRPDSDLNVGVRARGEETAAAGPSVVARDARDAHARLVTRLPAEPADRRVAIAHRPGEEMLLDEYLKTRCVELAVHLEDLALSADLPPRVPTPCLAVAVTTLFSAARDRHGDQAVLHALARRERDDREALRVL